MKKIPISYILFLICLLSWRALPSVAQDSKNIALKLDLKKAISMAFEASEEFKIQENEVQRKGHEYRGERSLLLPQVSGGISWSNNFEYPDVASTANTKDYDAYSKVEIDQKLFTFGKVLSSVRAAKEAIGISRYDKETTRQAIIYNTKLAYYTAYLAKRTLEIAQESYQHAVQNKEILENRSFSGRVSKHDNIKISADIASRKPTVNNARTDYYSAIETLKVVVGLESNKNIELAEGFLKEYCSFDRDTMALSLYNNQPAIKALARSIDQKKSLVRSKKAAFYPEVSAFASWSHKGSSFDSNLGKDELEDYGIAGVKVEVPVWTSGKTGAELAQARIDKNNAELNYQKGKEDYLLELDKALGEYSGYVKTLDSNREAVDLAEESFKLSQELFKSGQISVTDLNDSELILTNEKINKEMTLFNISITLAKIERLTLIGDRDEK